MSVLLWHLICAQWAQRNMCCTIPILLSGFRFYWHDNDQIMYKFSTQCDVPFETGHSK